MRDLQKVQRARTNYLSEILDFLKPPQVPSYRNRLPSDMTMSTDIQFAFSFVSALDICLKSFGDGGTVGARNADQADYGPLNPASLRLGLILCHRDLPGELTVYQELTDIRN
ncbi:hypothetical protein L3X38_032105 [Prunus dulcis]|uniref:Uncharacterized protein n=1 Tax=Prunus dulcis TaxID=3755 RepID=A0AAD4YWA1_PRUDU|nr:hypothetical protein L3X38_032105 [Prunus dulcis]